MDYRGTSTWYLWYWRIDQVMRRTRKKSSFYYLNFRRIVFHVLFLLHGRQAQFDQGRGEEDTRILGIPVRFVDEWSASIRCGKNLL